MHAMTDAEIQRAVLHELSRDRRVEPTEVGIEVDNSVVTLTGTVSSWEKKLAAEEVAHRVVGVLDVANDLAVHDPARGRPSDTEIAGAIRQALIRDVLIPEANIQTTVRDGIVILEGEVDYPSERDEAIWKIRSIAGVCGIDDQLAVRPREAGPTAAAIDRMVPPATPEEIEEALGELDASTIARIVETGASVDDIVEAQADLEDERQFDERRQPSTTRVAEVRAMLEELVEEEDDLSCRSADPIALR